MPKHRRSRLSLLPTFALVVACAALPVRAQLVGGTVRSLALPPRPTLPVEIRRLPGAVVDTADEAVSQLHRLQVERLLGRHGDVIDVDTLGAPVVRSEVVAIDPTGVALALAREAGFGIGEEQALESLGLRVVVLRAPEGIGTTAALALLRQLDPAGSYDFNHLYFGSGMAAAGAGDAPPAAVGSIRVGLIDSGVARGHQALAGVELHAWGCDDDAAPDAHGTAVASLLVGGTNRAAAAGTTLFAADIYCGQPTGGAATGFAQAMAWLARQDLAVINLSLVGPDNALLRRATRALAASGRVLVAAVGNDGPTAAPLYPAAYPEVIGVTAVNGRGRALPEALRGAQVDFAARGNGLRAARPDGGWDKVRGTSFAAPLVARAAAALIDGPDTGRADQVRTALAEQARDLGKAGRDDTYGHGLIVPVH